MSNNLSIDREQEVKELISMAKERMGDLLNDDEIEEIAQSVFEELLKRGIYSRLKPGSHTERDEYNK